MCVMYFNNSKANKLFTLDRNDKNQQVVQQKYNTFKNKICEKIYVCCKKNPNNKVNPPKKKAKGMWHKINPSSHNNLMTHLLLYQNTPLTKRKHQLLMVSFLLS